MTKLICYYRVSTKAQEKSGLGLEAQRASVEAFAKSKGFIIIGEHVEAESGAKARPKLDEAVADCKQMGCTLIFAKVDRLARDVKIALEVLDAGVPLVFVDMPDLGTMEPATGRMILTIVSAVAEFEGRRIRARIKAAFAAKKARGEPMGRNVQDRCYLTTASRADGGRKSGETKRRRRDEFYKAVAPKLLTLKSMDMDDQQIADTMNKQGRFDRGNKLWTKLKVSLVLKHVSTQSNCSLSA